ncbi:MAG: glycosyltransferase family 39 protein, partial [Chloroflexota bacterium]|nr:glycosyltransferase family 39 protein [Chloroflexota bacterium]
MRIPLILYGLAFGARMVLILLFPDPAYPDSYYYSEVTRSIVEGRGLNVDFVWIFAEVGGFLPAHPMLPIPSNAHWMPLASFVQVPFVALLGQSPIVGALPFALLGSLAAPLTWLIAREAGSRASVAVGGGILTALPALSLVFMPQPDNFSLFQPLGAAALWMAARGLKGDGRAFAVGGLLVGLATLSRTDGVLIGAVFGLAFLWDRWRAWRSGGGRLPVIPLRSAVAFVALFLVVMGPWWFRQLEVFGQLSPSTSTGR